MRTILHILVAPPDDLARRVMAGQCALADAQVEVVDLSSGPEPDYRSVVEKIFAADSIEVW